jgi:S1-C subfamily serine protease
LGFLSAYSQNEVNGTTHRLSVLSQRRQCGLFTLRMLVIGAPPNCGGPRMPGLAAVVKRIAPSVVGIESKGRVAVEPDTKRRQARKGVVLAGWHEIHMVGSGVVFDARRGLIITNSHVIDHADDIKVNLTDGRTLPARRVGADPETDVAPIQVRADGLTELPFGDSDRLEVGDFVFAVDRQRPAPGQCGDRAL